MERTGLEKTERGKGKQKKGEKRLNRMVTSGSSRPMPFPYPRVNPSMFQQELGPTSSSYPTWGFELPESTVAKLRTIILQLKRTNAAGPLSIEISVSQNGHLEKGKTAFWATIISETRLFAVKKNRRPHLPAMASLTLL
ncbi:hypothetical protein Mapa_016994 [Marchantia paleacea]|nr:hypothetical protein Mapa_016994 [Marchantia paleacea]